MYNIIKDQQANRQAFFNRFQFLCLPLLVVALIVLPLSSASAQPAGGGGKTKQTVQSPRKQVTTIIFSGLAGAVLGLSTLSFYGRPQERLSNIAVGGAIGLIIGAGYSTYQAARQLKPRYALIESAGVSFESLERFDQLSAKAVRPVNQPVKFSYQWHF